MDLDEPDDNDDSLDLRLSWPDDELRNPPSTPPARPTAGPAELTPAKVRAGDEGVQAALAAVAVRLEALTAATASFRTLMSDRLTDYADLATQALNASVRNLEEYRHLHERTLAELRRALLETAETGDRPPAAELTSESSQAVGERLDALAKEVAALRRRVGLRARGEPLTADQLGAIADAVAQRLSEG